MFYRLEPDAASATGPVKEKKKVKNEFRPHFEQMQSERIERRRFCSQEQRILWGWKKFGSNFCAIYRYDKKAWMTSNLFTEWLENFERTVRLKKRKVVLLLDNATSYKVSEDIRNVRVHFLPSNRTAQLQPNDAGIVRSLKQHYRKGL